MTLNVHHKRALALLGFTAVMVAVLGTAIGQAAQAGPFHGIVCTTGFATTAGCDIPLHGHLQYALAEAAMVLVLPLWAAAFSFLTAALTRSDGDRRHEALKAHVTATARGDT